MTFAELLTEVYNLTARPDLIDLTKSAVKAATLKAHQTDFYSKDIWEQQVVFPSSEYVQSLDYVALIPNYRALKYMRHWDTSDSTAGNFFTVLTPEEILDEWGRERTNVAYVAGRILEIKSAIEFDTVIIAAYVNPVVTETGYSSWVASLYPYAIVHEAARVVFATIAMDAEKNSQKELVAEQYAELKINNTVDQGY